MGAIGYFPAYDHDDSIADVAGSSFGEPDGTMHRIEVLEDAGHLIVRVKLQQCDECVDLFFDRSQAKAFGAGVQSVLIRLGLDK